MVIGHVIGYCVLADLAAVLCFAILRIAVLTLRDIPVVALAKPGNVRQSIGGFVFLGLLAFWGYQFAAAALPTWLRALDPIPDLALPPWLPLRIAGLAIVVLGSVVYVVSVLQLGDSWRLGIDEGSPGPLVTKGIYSFARHPIYLAFLLFFLGVYLAFGRFILLVLGGLLAWGVLASVGDEERFLRSRFGTAYEAYKMEVGSYATFQRKR